MTTDPLDPKSTTTTTGRSISTNRVASVIWLAALASVLGLHVWFPRIDSTVNDTYNVDVGGRNALYQFAERRMDYVTRNHEPLENWLDPHDHDFTLCLLGPARYPSAREWQALLAWVNGGGKLLVAARWNDAELPIPGIQAGVKSTVAKKSIKLPGADYRKKSEGSQPENSPSGGPANGSAGSDGEPSLLAPQKAAAAVPVSTVLDPRLDFTWKTEGVIEIPNADSSAAEVLIKTAERSQAVRIHHGLGQIVLVASDFIFSNAALHEGDHRNGILAVKLLNAAGTTDSIVFDESLNETGTPKVVGVLVDPALRPATIQLVALIVLFGWRGNLRFGGLLPGSSPARHDVADHTNSLGNLYFKAHHGTGVLREYLDQLKTELRLRFATGHERRILLPIAQKARMTLDEVQRVLADAETAARKPKLSRRESAAHIRKLAQLRQAARRSRARA
jgi:hypothetical protein